MLRHHQILLRQASRETAFVDMVIHIHEQDNLIASLLPLLQLHN
jgi:hypothetical protein